MRACVCVYVRARLHVHDSEVERLTERDSEECDLLQAAFQVARQWHLVDWHGISVTVCACVCVRALAQVPLQVA